MLKGILALILASVKLGDSIRCFQCRSDIQSNCGDPWIPNGIQSVECDNFSTQRTFSCYKISTYIPGGFITVRGCAPFTSDYFPKEMQRGLAGSYWKVFNSNYFT